MAAKDTIHKLITDIQKGKIVNANRLKKILDKLEVNVLKTSVDQLDIVERIIKADSAEAQKIAGAHATSVSTIKDTVVSSVGDKFEGDVDVGATTFERLRPISRLINSERDLLNEEVYELGPRDTSVMTLLLTIMKDEYRYEKDVAKRARQMALINNALKLSTQIDTLSTNELKRVHAIDSKNPGDDQLLEAIEIAGAKADFSVEAESTLISNLKKPGGFGAIIAIDLKLQSDNQLKGRLAGTLSKKLIDALSVATYKGKDTELEKAFGKSLDFKNLRSPASMKMRLDAMFNARLAGKPYKETVKKSKVRIDRKIAATNTAAKQLKLQVTRRKATLKTLLLAQQKKKKFVIPTVTLKAIINESLAEFIRLRMGDSEDPAIKLRNQSGRFSESARLLTLTRTEAGAYVGTYDFQQNPYGVFLPGQRLGTQQRDPRLYIEGAARDIAVQVLKRNFKGLHLRLK